MHNLLLLKMRNKFTKLFSAKKRKASSSRWLLRHINDEYVNLARSEGYRSRSAYKLIHIQQKFKILKPGYTVVDLGAAPGGWSQVATKFLKPEQTSSKIIAVDILEMSPIPNVTVLQSDFYDQNTIDLIVGELGENKVDVVMSDIAPNTTGDPSIDNVRILDLCNRAFEFAINVTKTHGHFLCKIFQGGVHQELLSKIKRNFHKVKHFKPEASRQHSKEMYLLALDFKG